MAAILMIFGQIRALIFHVFVSHFALNYATQFGRCWCLNVSNDLPLHLRRLSESLRLR